MAYDSGTGAALLQFSNETLSTSPDGDQTLDYVLQISSLDAGLSWSQPKRVTPVKGLAPTSGNGIELSDGRLLFSMDSIPQYRGDHVLYSDDSGESFKMTDTLARAQLDEIQQQIREYNLAG